MNILVADDDRTTRLLLTRTLERWGYRVIAAAHGEDAWARMQEGEVRILISDWEMPHLDGPGLCARIRASRDGGYVYILLLTSHDDPSYIVRGLDAGADDFVSKPFDPAELRARLNVGRRIVALQDELAAKNRALERANAELARIAATDPLMQIGNRRSFEDAIARALGDTGGEGRPFGVLMVDIDHFKRLNDGYGHPFGDRVLATVSSALRAALPPGDELFRYGGEEIVVIARTACPEALRALGEQLRNILEGLRIGRAGGTPVAITASFGAALYDGREPIPWETLVARADDALYAAKHGGRNQVQLWEAAPARATG